MGKVIAAKATFAMSARMNGAKPNSIALLTSNLEKFAPIITIGKS